MVSNRNFFGFAIFGFLMGFLLLAIAGVSQFSGHQGGSEYTMLALPWCGLGVLAAWAGQSFQQQNERLDKIEAQLSKQ